jgi:DNA-binding transcriptional ArsR family regulator
MQMAVNEMIETPVEPSGCAGSPVEEMAQKAQEAALLLKALAHEGRLLILCHLSAGEKSVSELETALGTRQAAVSQQLARLRLEGMVSCRREGKAIYYSLADPKVARMIGVVYELYCGAVDGKSQNAA